jgi:hypothetical protein
MPDCRYCLSGVARDHWGPGHTAGAFFARYSPQVIHSAALRSLLCVRYLLRRTVKSTFAGRSMGPHRMNVAVLPGRQLYRKWPELIAGGIFGVLGVIVGIIFWEASLGFRWF